jgi:hypothetical protein
MALRDSIESVAEFHFFLNFMAVLNSVTFVELSRTLR